VRSPSTAGSCSRTPATWRRRCASHRCSRATARPSRPGSSTGWRRPSCRCVPHEYDAWRLRAELELKLGREEEAYDTLLEGAQRFDRPHTAVQAIGLLTRARAIEPRDAEVALDLARLYVRAGMIESALALLAALAPCVRGSVLRRVRGLQWRITLSFYHAWRWLAALWQELRGDGPATTAAIVGRDAAPGRAARAETAPEPLFSVDA
jgi:hypothetical protein